MAAAAAVAEPVVEEAKEEPKTEAAQGEKKDSKKKAKWTAFDTSVGSTAYSKKKGKSKVGLKGNKKVDGTRLNIKNIPVDTTASELKKLFAPFGTVAAAEVKFKDDGKSRGFGYVIFPSDEEAHKATAAMNDSEVAGKKISVGPAERRPDDGKGKGKGGRNQEPSGPCGGGSGYRLNVKNMYGSTTAEKLKELFSPFGEVLDAQVKLKDNGKSKGFGFVVMPTEEEAAAAIAAMHEKEVEGKKLNVSPAERRPDEEGDIFLPPGMGGGNMSKKEKEAMAAYMQQVMLMQQQAMMMAWSQYGKEYEGVLTQLTSVAKHQKGKKEEAGAKGDGFIECEETLAMYGVSIYADRSVLPKEAEVGSKVKFTVLAQYGQHPAAATVELVGSES